MNIIKLLLLLCSFIITSLALPVCAKSKCQIRTLKQVCDVCEERALNKLSTGSVCPQCPEVNCPAVSQACIRTDSFKPFLKSSYTLTAMIWEGHPDMVFKLNIIEGHSPGTFLYDVRYRNFHIAISDNLGFLIYDVVNFTLPLSSGENNIVSYSCVGTIDNTSVLIGLCSSITRDSSDINLKSYSFPFTAVPDSNVLQ